MGSVLHARRGAPCGALNLGLILHVYLLPNGQSPGFPHTESQWFVFRVSIPVLCGTHEDFASEDPMNRVRS